MSFEQSGLFAGAGKRQPLPLIASHVSDYDIEAHLVAPAIVSWVVHRRRLFERPAVLQICGDSGRPFTTETHNSFDIL
jgi:hypothetical protein